MAEGTQPHPVSITDLMRAGVQPGAGVGPYNPCTLFCRDSRLKTLLPADLLPTEPIHARRNRGDQTRVKRTPLPRRVSLPRLDSNQQPPDPESGAATNCATEERDQDVPSMPGPIQLYPAVTQGALGALQGERYVRADRPRVAAEQPSLAVHVRYDARQRLGEVGPHVAQYNPA